MFQFPGNDFQPTESPNPFMPRHIYIQPQIVLSRIEQSNIICRELRKLSATVEVNRCTDETAKIKNLQPTESEEIHRLTVPNSCSELIMIENKPVSDSQHNEDSNSSTLDQIRSKIVVGLPNSKAKKSDQLNLMINAEKYISMWSINLSPSDSESKSPVLTLSGTLLGDDRVTVLENHHDAGVLEVRKRNNLVKTKNGLYCLIGHLVRGSPNELYNACLAASGIPRIWKSIAKQLLETENTTKTNLNFSLDSPAGPENNIKKSTFHVQLVTSTPKRLKRTFAVFETPSPVLKKKCSKANTKSSSPMLQTINIKERLLCSKRQLLFNSNNSTVLL